MTKLQGHVGGCKSFKINFVTILFGCQHHRKEYKKSCLHFFTVFCEGFLQI